LKGIDKSRDVFVNRDMTREERIIERRLRDERKKRNSELTEKGPGLADVTKGSSFTGESDLAS
jgi:hypothetical protein